MKYTKLTRFYTVKDANGQPVKNDKGKDKVSSEIVTDLKYAQQVDITKASVCDETTTPEQLAINLRKVQFQILQAIRKEGSVMGSHVSPAKPNNYPAIFDIPALKIKAGDMIEGFRFRIFGEKELGTGNLPANWEELLDGQA
jgi:hypothetical protein